MFDTPSVYYLTPGIEEKIIIYCLEQIKWIIAANQFLMTDKRLIVNFICTSSSLRSIYVEMLYI